MHGVPPTDGTFEPQRALGLLVARARGKRWLALAVANLRILIGFAFVPAGLKKLVDEPFTDPANTGPFHDFLHAFHATGWFYNFVGAMQLVVAILLVTQRFALAGALLALPILTAIVAFCWSTQVYPTATVATLMWLGTLALVVWDYHRWRGVLARDRSPLADPVDAPIAEPLWRACGAAVFVLYVLACVAMGEVYRPKGARPDDPGFYLFPILVALPLVTLALDRRWLRRARR